MWYYGYRAANKVSPEDDLFKEYFTSSRYVKEFIHVNGKPDVVRVHRTFVDRSSALRFEERFLHKVGAVHDSRWLNKSNRGKFHVPSTLPDEWRKRISEGAKGNKRAAGPRSVEFKDRMKAFNAAKAKDPEFRARLKRVRNARATEASGWKLSEETKTKMRKPKPFIKCPYCGAEGGKPAMTRWHFDNCKGIKDA